MVLPAEVEELIASLRRQIAALQAEVADLRRQLGQDSSNSSKPPSSDGLKKSLAFPAACAELGQGERRAEGPQGRHVAASRRSRLGGSAQGVRLRPLRAAARSEVGGRDREAPGVRPCRAAADGHGRRATIYRCARCRGETKAAFPDGVISAVQYGERLKTAAIYLNVQQLLPEDRAAQALSDLFGAPLICPASIVAWVGKKAQELRQVYAFIGVRVAEAKVRHLDETGFRIAGKLQWLHTTSSLAFTFYRADRKHGAIPEDLHGGVVVHDHFLPYRRLDTVDHAFCNAHILRELKSLIEFDQEAWAEHMRAMLLAANLAVNKAREAGAAGLAANEIQAFVERYWAAMRLGLAFHRRLPKLATEAARGRVKHRARPQPAPKTKNLPNRNLAFPHRLRRALHQ